MIGIEGNNRIIIADSWFVNLSLFRGLRMIGLHLIGLIKQEGNGELPKVSLCKLLDKEGKPRGIHVPVVTEIDNKNLIGLA